MHACFYIILATCLIFLLLNIFIFNFLNVYVSNACLNITLIYFKIIEGFKVLKFILDKQINIDI